MSRRVMGWSDFTHKKTGTRRHKDYKGSGRGRASTLQAKKERSHYVLVAKLQRLGLHELALKVPVL